VEAVPAAAVVITEPWAELLEQTLLLPQAEAEEAWRP